MGYINDQININIIKKVFNGLKSNKEICKTYYIGLINNDEPEEGYNIIN